MRHGFHDLDIFVSSLGSLKDFVVLYIPLILIAAGHAFLLVRVSLLSRNKYITLILFSIFVWMFLELHVPAF